MKLCRCRVDGAEWFGVVEGQEVELLSEPPFERTIRSGRRLSLDKVQLLSPTAPSKIVCVGLNYRAHAEEMKKPLPKSPLLFLKPPSAVSHPGEPIVLPPESAEVHYEAELGVVIGKVARRVSSAQARSCVLGYTCFNDVTARDIQRAEVQYTRAKSFDTFAPFGPFVETDLDPTKVEVTARVDGAVRQRGNTADMVFDVFELVSFVSRTMTLLPGDVLATGTPPGVGPLLAGQVVEVEIEGVGVLRSAVVAPERS